LSGRHVDLLVMAVLLLEMDVVSREQEGCVFDCAVAREGQVHWCWSEGGVASLRAGD